MDILFFLVKKLFKLILNAPDIFTIMTLVTISLYKYPKPPWTSPSWPFSDIFPSGKIQRLQPSFRSLMWFLREIE
jgi:hypothetical protein